MKKRSPRDVPDFAPHPPQGRDGGHHGPASMHAPGAPGGRRPPARDTAPPPTRLKPQATSAKSGRRGQ